MEISIPWFRVRRFARTLAAELQKIRSEREVILDQLDRIIILNERLCDELEKERGLRRVATEQLNELGAASLTEIELKHRNLLHQIQLQEERLRIVQQRSQELTEAAQRELALAQQKIVETDEVALLQEVGIYEYHHRLSDVVAYSNALKQLQQSIKAWAKIEGGAVLADDGWTVNGSSIEGEAMVRDYSRLMLRAFNTEADALVRDLKPYKLASAIGRLEKSAETIERLGRALKLRISPAYLQLRIDELTLTADYLQKEAERKEEERLARERLREERKAQQEIEREKQRLEKERQHYANALDVLLAKGDDAGAARIREQLDEVQHNIESVDFRAANVRAGYVYVISNIGSFGESMVKIGMTRRLDPRDRIRELSDASVPFNFDTHALFFSDDAVGIEAALHERLAHARVNLINQRREFFRVSPLEVKELLRELSGELLEFHEIPEALEYRQVLNLRNNPSLRSEPLQYLKSA
ncbi:DUF4041 domain-containing protein [Pseudorhodoplanes sp.]|uniref:DUF4041 domain-containing protein n=1 Tax=Pseudorhodoplanes sp. TaxID=1934341 RepID=UPI002C215490|nr:DUF4041 domain-containing protein [Pseudorhodoplanes sp.]HWV40236.1 DUF4041 domain-containing protein [Pseudorhodoplanes sp.]